MTDWNGASSFHLDWVVPPELGTEFQAVEVQFRVVNMPMSPQLIFWGFQASLSDGSGFHMGLQWKPVSGQTERGICFGGYKANNGGELDGGAIQFPMVDGNPNVGKFDWVEDQEYTLLMKKTVHGVAAYIDDKLVRELYTSPASLLRSPVVWTEDFQPTPSFASVAWRNAFVYNTLDYKAEIVEFVTNYQNDPPQSRIDTSSWVYNDDIWQSSGVGRMNATGTHLIVPKHFEQTYQKI